MDTVHVLLVSGSLRAASTNSALLRTAAAVAALADHIRSRRSDPDSVGAV